MITGSHPEYWSERALDALEGYVAEGGRLMYMGGNGFYWVVSSTRGEPYVMEVRKGEAGMRAWQAQPGRAVPRRPPPSAAGCGACAAARRRS